MNFDDICEVTNFRQVLSYSLAFKTYQYIQYMQATQYLVYVDMLQRRIHNNHMCIFCFTRFFSFKKRKISDLIFRIFENHFQRDSVESLTK